MTDSRGR